MPFWIIKYWFYFQLQVFIIPHFYLCVCVLTKYARTSDRGYILDDRKQRCCIFLWWFSRESILLNPPIPSIICICNSVCNTENWRVHTYLIALVLTFICQIFNVYLIAFITTHWKLNSSRTQRRIVTLLSCDTAT